jgi:hypothetical protein
MKTYSILMMNEAGIQRVFSTRNKAHKYLRNLGVHPIGDGFWGFDKTDTNEACAFYVDENKVQ